MPCYILGLRKRTTSSDYMCYTFWAFVAHSAHRIACGVRVLFWLYNFVGTSGWYSSNSPAMVFVGASCPLHKQLKQSTRSVSIHRVCINFPCHFWSLIVSIRLAFILYCITFTTFSLEMSSLDPVVATTAPGERLSSRPISSAYFFASFTILRRPFLSHFSSNCRTSSIVLSRLVYSLMAVFTLVILYWVSTDLSPLPPIFLGR